ncbi:MAG TPA: tRNA lysidine(34) synthetase TilS [Chitinophagaceae bacterium]|jgi:tRNA(Ile)-lysidine synthase
MNLLSSFIDTIAKGHLFSSKDRLLLAVSGGLDSSALCELCYQAGYDFVIAHCNFQLRGEESRRDEAFVRSLGNKYDKPVLVKAFDTAAYAEDHKLSIQEAARDLRYKWFFELVGKPESPTHILTAHHANDNAETILMNLCRGSGLHGLTGIPVQSSGNRLLRPLLGFRREELHAFALGNGLAWVSDSSNDSIKYTRNLFRQQVIPAAEMAYPAVIDNLNAAAHRFKAIEAVYLDGIAAIKKKLYKRKGAEVHIAIKQFLGYNNTAAWYEVIKDFGFGEKQVDEVVKLCHSESGAWLEAPQADWRLIRHRSWLIAAPRKDEQAQTVVISAHDRQVGFASGRLYLETRDAASFTLPSGSALACLDARHIRFPLLLRKWKAGDYFYPLGMQKKKKLARFFIDRKLSKTDKEGAWVLEMNKKIIWVVGHRIDERFKITPATKEILKIVLEAGSE